ncbi:thiamine pyrophosphokinase Thi80 [Crepidotus variabilis]|uniref:Thiamine pyrophosphokinase n=1 Tax=Crepidotus variabilis TaxID=179855 RepID=A0A9P6E380_9AGAR|nr:thiamine pyrophosphokinase Thi80 [Crepidotus variabilis]
MSNSNSSLKSRWNVEFLRGHGTGRQLALIILNQPFSELLLSNLWKAAQWHCCADGGANRLYDTFQRDEDRKNYLPNLIKGDLDSIRPEVRRFYERQEVNVIEDDDQNSTDLMKCVHALQEKEVNESSAQYHIILLGGLSGRLDHTVHTLSYLHKLRKIREQVFAVTDENIGWVLDRGEHEIQIDHDLLGKTCGLLPVGIDQTILSTSGFRWNLTNQMSSFEGLMSTSNHLVRGENLVWVETSQPIWWTVELKHLH